MMIQWGCLTQSAITYPIAFTTVATPVFAKQGWSSAYTKSDTGITAQSLTGFGIGSMGVFGGMNWIAIGY